MSLSISINYSIDRSIKEVWIPEDDMDYREKILEVEEIQFGAERKCGDK